jgi:hypothetical protein
MRLAITSLVGLFGSSVLGAVVSQYCSPMNHVLFVDRRRPSHDENDHGIAGLLRVRLQHHEHAHCARRDEDGDCCAGQNVRARKQHPLELELTASGAARRRRRLSSRCRSPVSAGRTYSTRRHRRRTLQSIRRGRRPRTSSTNTYVHVTAYNGPRIPPKRLRRRASTRREHTRTAL